ncbi:uncharacterized protein (DUF2252 family) [Nitrosomonas sp. Nm84]|uniref:DUF2252 family protein n=1 Tax=Nitrosomonas sp. Nm84 TaxID=200124 RepID=UPI000D774DF4|nr:DUF2252 family protein [Nitrosomonas sp. Nm84]PXW86058.1 uncharacterized protein (DUF2252 family) [Nitrosomonas sp. Nm84]
MKIPSPDERRKLLIARRNKKMALSPHAYMRGNTIRYYEWLHSQRGHSLPHGPAIWICGDCHLGNLGPLADIDGKVDVQIRDFDQTVIGNPAHDLLRLALSLATAARDSNLPGIVTAHMLEHLIEGYEQALDTDEERISSIKKPDLVKVVIRSALKRTWKELAKERIVNTQPIISYGRNFWPLSKSEKNAIMQLFEKREILELVTTLKSRDNDTKVEVLNAAYWVKGCSSLGLLRYAVLLSVGEDDYCIFDIKEAVRAIAPRYQHASMPRDNANRVVEGARQMTPALGKRMIATRFLEHGVFIRELLPQDLKLELDQMSIEEAIHMSSYLAYVVGCAHARQMDDETRKSWRNELKLNRSKSLDTPAWLWKSVVWLLASHEAGYLEHCRKYALRLDGY